jgi:hypothetical protein
MTGDQAAGARRLSQSWGELVAVGKGLAVQVGAALAPALTVTARALATAGGAAVRFLTPMLQVAGGGIFDGLLDGAAGVAVAFEHWQDVLKMVPDLFADSMVLAWGEVKHLWENLTDFGSWFGTNFVEIFKNAVEDIGHLFSNLGFFVNDFLAAMVQKLQDPRKTFADLFDFDKEFGKLSAGIKPLAAEGPKLRERQFTDAERAAMEDLQKKLAPLGDEAQQLAGKFKAAFARPAQQRHIALGIEQAVQQVSSAGSFSAFAAQALASGPAERMARGIEGIEKNTARLVKHAEDDDEAEFD